jgi:cytochrome b
MRLVYDLPTRVFHWSFVLLFLTSILISKFVESDSVVFNYHMLSGLLMLLIIILRVVWGLVGTRYAKFSGFDLRPKNLVSYMLGLLKSDHRKWPGHNPATSFAAITMMAIGFSLGVTGLLMTYGNQKERFEDIHELLSTAFIILVISHLAGLIIHTIRHKEMIAVSMMSGEKKDITVADSIPNSRRAVGFAFLAVIFAAAIYLATNFSKETRMLNLFGTPIQFGDKD